MYKVVSANRHREKFYSAVVPLSIALEYKIGEWTSAYPNTPIYCFKTISAARFFIDNVDVVFPVLFEVEHKEYNESVTTIWFDLLSKCTDYESYKQAMFEYGETLTHHPFTNMAFAQSVKPIKIIGFHNVRSHIVV